MHLDNVMDGLVDEHIKHMAPYRKSWIRASSQVAVCFTPPEMRTDKQVQAAQLAFKEYQAQLSNLIEAQMAVLMLAAETLEPNGLTTAHIETFFRKLRAKETPLTETECHQARQALPIFIQGLQPTEQPEA